MKRLIFLSFLVFTLIASSQSSTEADNPISVENTFKEGIVTKQSTRNFEETYESLRQALEENPAIRIMAEIDHQENAKTSGLKLSPTRLIIFGNPKLGTPLMQEEQSIALDLPQKMLIWEDTSGNVYISFNDPYYVAERHGLKNNDELLEKMEKALNKLANRAAGI
ncbi:DUF302 domain-containing protein [Christiangramia aestuarii]|uniref:DUF302 domain-containing protein n=1 Tax=Christiangramia aestuarii TaxID=1028746 RepID=A0A7K1LMF4_9FLAO|nr:DUF302 domain-containing protein [Christiangramia aestuarii]MUP41995.1 DUF302 domain-containing protein [Christiangramia aestuarii]